MLRTHVGAGRHEAAAGPLVRAAVVAVGDELLLGDIVNGNAAWLGAQLAAVGAPVVHSAMVGDDVDRIVTAVRRALEDADVVVLTGGLGPTVDDLTRDAVAAVAGVPLDRDAGARGLARRALPAYGYTDLPAAVMRQADVPAGRPGARQPGRQRPGPAGRARRPAPVRAARPAARAGRGHAGRRPGRAGRPQRRGGRHPHPALRRPRRERGGRAGRGGRRRPRRRRARLPRRRRPSSGSA